MIVYRVQDIDGRGPWKPGFSDKWVIDREDLKNLPPWTVEFGGVNAVLRKSIAGMHVGCGCLTKQSLRRWFTKPEYDKLTSLGYHAVLINVGRVLEHSDIQCVFERSLALKYSVEPFNLY